MRELRRYEKKLGLSQKDFAQKVGISQRSVSWGEQPGNNVPDSTIKSLCIVFRINEAWLRTGDGDMFIEPDTFSLNQFVRDRGGTDLEIEIVKAYFDLDKDARLAAVNYFIDRLTAAKAKAAEKEQAVQVFASGQVPDKPPGQPGGNDNRGTGSALRRAAI